MRKISKKGFTLVEMMLVIAIIVVLASVAAIGIGDAMTRYRTRQNEYKEQYIPAINDAQARVQNIISTTRPNRLPPTTAPTTSSSEATDGSDETTTATDGSEGSEGTESSSDITLPDPPEPSDETTVYVNPDGAASYDGEFVSGPQSAPGVVSLENNDDGTTTIGITKDNNSTTITIKDNGDGTYSMKYSGQQNPLGSCIGYTATNNYLGSQNTYFTLSSSDIANLNNMYGINIGG